MSSLTRNIFGFSKKKQKLFYVRLVFFHLLFDYLKHPFLYLLTEIFEIAIMNSAAFTLRKGDKYNHEIRF